MAKCLLLIVPCYNEEFRLPVGKFAEFIESHLDYDFCFVNDGSTDKTRDMLHDLAKNAKNKYVVECPENLGKAEAIRFAINTSLKKKSYDFVGYWDADLSTPLEAIHDFLRVYEKFPTLSMVIGSRVKLMGRRITRKLYRHYFGRVFATAVSVMLDLPVYDTQCGAKIIRSDLANKIFLQPFITPWFFDVELIFRTILLMGKEEAEKAIYELSLKTWEDIGGSKLKISDFLKTPYYLFKIFLHFQMRRWQHEDCP
jgi:glycosyltransferase involved in cell wall biosynthesis